jgi:hypothetical protein
MVDETMQIERTCEFSRTAPCTPALDDLCKDSSSQSIWTALPPIVGNSQTNTPVDLSATGPQHFFRVRELP